MNSDLDLGQYMGGRSHGSPDGKNSRAPPLSWRLDPEESLSDWKIVVTCSAQSFEEAATDMSENEEHVFHVHKNQLAVGPHRSEYFATLFRKTGVHTHSESESSTSTINLEPSAVMAFPAMLDFVYSLDGDVAATTETAAALRHLAMYFDIRELFVSVTGFIQRDMRACTAPVYLAEAAMYHDDKLRLAACTLTARNFGEVDADKLVALPPDLFESVVSSPHLDTDGETLSRRVAEYCRCRPRDVDGTLLLSLTNPKRMPKVAPEEALFLLRFALDRDQGATTSLHRRCLESCSTDWRHIVSHTIIESAIKSTQQSSLSSSPSADRGQESGDPRRQSSSSSSSTHQQQQQQHHQSSSPIPAGRTGTFMPDYGDLPPDVKISLLESSLCAASVDVDATVASKDGEIERLERTLSLRDSRIRKQGAAHDELLNIISDRDGEIDRLKRLVSMQEARIAQQDRKLNIKTEEIARWGRKDASKGAEITRLRNEISRLKGGESDGSVMSCGGGGGCRNTTRRSLSQERDPKSPSSSGGKQALIKRKSSLGGKKLPAARTDNLSSSR